MIELRLQAANAEDLKNQLRELLGEQPTEKYHQISIEELPPFDTQTEEVFPEVKPVITQAQMEENVKSAPVHVVPEQPTLEEVRAALKELRDRKGSAAVKELLNAFQANSLPELKPEDYLGALARAKTEV